MEMSNIIILFYEDKLLPLQFAFIANAAAASFARPPPPTSAHKLMISVYGTFAVQWREGRVFSLDF